MITCEMAIAVPVSEGDRGTWSTDFVELDDSFVGESNEVIETAAREKMLERIDGKFEVANIWLYHYNTEEDENGL